MVDDIKNYYAKFNGDTDEVAYEVEDVVNEYFTKLLKALDKKYKK
ncbi:MAG: PIG-S family GPI transamidase component [Clostridia bacterium]|nr:PIG-S family GPI transamidase component [Clostridia bacterium]